MSLHRFPAWQDAHETFNYFPAMKQRSSGKRRARPAGANRAPSFEECLTFVMAHLSHSRDGLETALLTAKEKQRFRQMERKADALDLDDYRAILCRVLAPGLHDVANESKVQVEMLHGELREFFKRYEILSWQVVPGKATKQTVFWTLSHRFFLPWLAFRLALHLPDAGDTVTAIDNFWFIPQRGGDLDSFVMKVIDKYVRRKNESNARLARRFYTHFPEPKREAHAVALEGDFSKYSKLKTTPSDATLKLIIESSPAVPHLRLKLVLARAMDRCLRDARKVFNDEQLLCLLDYFALCFTHFRSLIKQVRSEMPPAEQGKVWLRLNSMTYMGNTPGQHDRFYPLMDNFLSELARKINDELKQTVLTGKLRPTPRNEAELNAGTWSFGSLSPISETIEGAPFHATVKAAVEDSRRIFQGQIDLAAASRTRQRFVFLGLVSLVMLAEKRPGLCNDADARLAEAECKRLFHLIYKQTPQPGRSQVALDFLKYLIEPYRPKADEDRQRAKNLFKVVSKFLRQNKLQGAVHYLHGCLHALEGNQQQALRAFVSARKLGHESSGEFWINLLRVGLLTAERVNSVRERKNFAKHARLYGIFSNDATPRSNEMQAQMKEDDFRRTWTTAFNPFPQSKALKPKSRSTRV